MVASISVEEFIQIIENLLTRQQKQIWEFLDIDFDICQHISEQKTQLEFPTEDVKFNQEHSQSIITANVLNSIETQLTKYNIHLYELNESRIEIIEKLIELKDQKPAPTLLNEVKYNEMTENVDLSLLRETIDTPVVDDCKSDDNDSEETNDDNSSTKSSAMCFICKKSFSNSVRLKEHKKICCVDTKCPFCGMQLSTRSALSRHIKRRHTSSILCSLCKKNCLDSVELREHKKCCGIDLKCSFCGMQVASRDKLIRHIRRNHSDATLPLQFACNKCDEKFHNRVLRRTHLKIVHSIDHAYPCGLCDRAFARIVLLEDHMITHTGGIKPYLCDICDERFAGKAGIRSHILQKHATHRFLCSVCGIAKSTSSQLNYHMATHSAGKYACDLCDKKFVNRFGFKNHRLTHTGEKKFSCTECNKHFINGQSLKRHMNEIHIAKKTIACDMCNAKFKSMDRLRQHKRTSHILRKSIKCAECGKLFVTQKGHDDHLLKHSGEQNFPCPECPKKYYTESELNNHLKGHRGAYACDICNLTLNSISGIFNHKRSKHSNERHECKICKKLFITLSNLERHEYIHSGERPFKCDLCEKGFVNKHDMLTHRRVHTGEKPFNCSHCNRSFTDKRNMMKHMNTHKN